VEEKEYIHSHIKVKYFTNRSKTVKYFISTMNNCISSEITVTLTTTCVLRNKNKFLYGVYMAFIWFSVNDNEVG